MPGMHQDMLVEEHTAHTIAVSKTSFLRHVVLSLYVKKEPPIWGFAFDNEHLVC